MIFFFVLPLKPCLRCQDICYAFKTGITLYNSLKALLVCKTPSETYRPEDFKHRGSFACSECAKIEILLVEWSNDRLKSRSVGNENYRGKHTS